MKIQAVQYTGDNYDELKSFCPSIRRMVKVSTNLREHGTSKLYLDNISINVGDYVVHEDDTFFVCEPFLFRLLNQL